MFSPIFATSARRRSSTDSPPSRLLASSDSSVPAPAANALAATAWAKPRKSCSRATKSVSQLISTMAALRPSADFSTTMTPSAATRAAFLSALASPCLRISSAAASRSPLVSSRAFLHSIIPAPVRSRSCLTASAVIVITVCPHALRGLQRRNRCRATQCQSLLSAARAATAGATTAAPCTTRRARRGPTIRDRRRDWLQADCSRYQCRILCVQLVGDIGSAAFDNLIRIRSRRTRATAATGRGLLANVGGRTRTTTLGGLLARIAGLVQLYEFVLAHRCGRHGLLALNDSIRHTRRIQLHGTHRVVISGDDVVNSVRRAIGVHDRDDRDAELMSLMNGALLVTDIDDEHGIRQGIHVFDTTKTALQLVHLATQLGGFLLTALFQRAGGCQFGDLAQPLDGLADGLEIGEHAAQPALVHKRLTGTGGFALHRFAGRALCAYEQHFAAVGNDALDEVRSFCVQGLRLFQIDDVDFISFTKDVLSHLRVPETGLMSEMDARFQHLSH